MCDIIGILKSWTDDNGAMCAKLELQCSTADDLPDKDEVVGGFKTKPGSIAQLIQAGTFVTLDENGTWYPEAEGGEDEADAASTLSVPLTLGKTVNPSVIEPDFEERDAKRPEGGEDDAEIL